MKKILISSALVAMLITGCQQPVTQAQNMRIETGIESSLDVNNVAGVPLNDFRAKDLSGQEINADVFKQSKITVVNLWGTFCGPCIDELPEFQELSTTLNKEEAQVIGILTDGENLEEAKRIVEKLGVTYTTMVPDQSLQEQLVNKFDYVPVTLFVNQEGIVYDSFIPGSASKEDVEKIIESLSSDAGTSIMNTKGDSKGLVEINGDEETYDNDVVTLEQVLGMDMRQLSKEQIETLRLAYNEIEKFEFNEDGSNEEAYYGLLDAFDLKMKDLGLKIPYYTYMEYADDHKAKISSYDYKQLENLNDKYMDMMEDTDFEDEEAYDNVVSNIEAIFTRSGLPGKEVTAQVENRNVHYARFDVNDGKIIYSRDNLVKEDKLTIQQKKLYNRLWAHIVKILPAEYMDLLTRFEINTDGYANVMAHVVEEKEDYSKWRLAIDLKDAVNADGSFSDEFTNTVIHEFAHVMTLHKGELQGEHVVDEDAFSTQEGYLKTDSYLNKFYQQFWKDIADAHQVATDADAESGSGEAIYEFYDKYADQFVSDYAATNPGEDIAETYRVFVMEEKPTGNTIRDQKINFMYEFEELVKIREDIRTALNVK